MRRSRTSPATLFPIVLLQVVAVAGVAGAGGIELAVAARSDGPPAGVTVITQPGSVAHEIALVDGNGSLSVPASALSARAITPGFWSPPVDLSRVAGGTVEVGLWPAGTFRGRIGGGPDDLRPVEITLVPVGGATPGRQPDHVRLLCDTLDGRLDGCAAPAGDWHLRIRVPGFAVEDRYGLTVTRDEPLELGEIDLRPGGRILGRVRSAAGEPLTTAALVVAERRLPEPLEALDGSDEDPFGPFRARPDDGGFFELAGLGDGGYLLTADDDGHFPASTTTLGLRAGDRFDLPDPLLLQPELEVEVTVSPALDPGGAAWTVELHPASPPEEPTGPPLSGTTVGGSWSSPPVPPGRYGVTVDSGGGDRIASRIAEISWGSTTVPIDLAHVAITGHVTLGSEPLAADLRFTSPDGARITSVSDGHGDFDLLLPGPGRWAVRVTAAEEGIRYDGAEIEIEPDHRDEIVIEVPDTRLPGRVLDDRRDPVAGATVTVTGLAAAGERSVVVDETTDDDGRFEIAGLDPGQYRLEATDGARRSPLETVEVPDEGPATEVDLFLLDGWTIRGRVLASAGPVAGAHLWALPFTAAGEWAVVAAPRTGTLPDGSFTLSMPPDADMVRVAVLAPGHTFAAWTTRRDPGRPLEEATIRLSDRAGTLRLRWPGRHGVVVVDGVPISPHFLTQWLAVNGVRPNVDELLEVPAMPAGRYHLCALTAGEEAAVIAGIAAPSGRTCTDGFLVAGGVLELTAPSPD